MFLKGELTYCTLERQDFLSRLLGIELFCNKCFVSSNSRLVPRHSTNQLSGMLAICPRSHQ